MRFGSLNFNTLQCLELRNKYKNCSLSFVVGNVIPLVGAMESLKKDEGLIPMDFGKKQYICIYFSKAFHKSISIEHSS
jgi:hypothetical protein